MDSPSLTTPTATTKPSGFLIDETSIGTDKQSSIVDGPSEGEEGASGQSAEDLFLNLAEDTSVNKDTTMHEAQSRFDRRVSRGRRPTQRQALSSPSDNAARPRRDSSDHDSGYVTRSVIQTAEAPGKYRRGASASSSLGLNALPPRSSASISADQRFNAYRNRYAAAINQGSNQTSRRTSASDALQRPSTYRPSRLNNSSTRGLESASNATSPLDQRQASIADGAESIVSTTAQSTVWDELHELKSRIHKMELQEMGGTQSNGSGERPRTATTTITTMSSSPKNPLKSSLSSAESQIGGPGAANLHPLLHQSLARCKRLLHPALHRSLELAAHDALEMVVLVHNGGSQGTVYSSASVVDGMVMDRQLRRKADNVCRNLTDLCIALCEGKLDLPPTPAQSPPARTGSRDASSSAGVNHDMMFRTYSRHVSLEPEVAEVRSSPSRALSRVEARRSSLLNGLGSNNNSPRTSDSIAGIYSIVSPKISAKLSRTGTSIHHIRHRPGVTEADEEEPALRAPSRATTDITSGTRRRSYRLSRALSGSKVADREYSSIQSLPDSSPLGAVAPVRPLNGTSLKVESPRSPSSASFSLRRQGSRNYLERGRDRGNDSDFTQADDNARLLKRRSLGVYTSTARSSLGLGERESVKRAQSVIAGGE